MRLLAALLALAAAAASSLALAVAAPGGAGTTALVSGPNGTPVEGFPIEDEVPAISGEGRFVAFVRGVADSGTGIFLRDMSGGTTPVNVPSGLTEQGLGFNAGAPSLSSDGRFLAFASEDPAISDEDRDSVTTPAGYTYPVRDIFVYDRSTGAISLVSRANGRAGAAANENSNLPAISADGRYVAFSSEATNLFHGAFGGVYVRDLQGGRTTLAGRASGAHGKPFGKVFNPSISAHGRWVAFVASTGQRPMEIAVRDMKSKRTIFASRANGRRGALASRDCSDPAISANGRYIAFATKARNLSRVDSNSVEDVFVRDLRTNRTVLVSRAQGKRGAAGRGDSSQPSISANGRYVAFESYASNLGPPDNGAIPDVFVRDLRSGRVYLASRASDGGPAANAPSQHPSISADGRYVAFDSRGSNLSPEDTLHTTSVFRFQVFP